jgi:hypothetical protein
MLPESPSNLLYRRRASAKTVFTHDLFLLCLGAPVEAGAARGTRPSAANCRQVLRQE